MRIPVQNRPAQAAVRTPVQPSVARPSAEQSSETAATGSGYIVIVYDNDVNTYAEVIHILQVATGCTLEEAEIEATLAAHDECVAAGCPGARSHEDVMAELLGGDR